MKHTKSIVSTSLAGLVLMALTACGQTSAAPPATVSNSPSSTAIASPNFSGEPSPSPSPSAAPTVVPAASPGPSGDFVAKIEDTDGYTFDLAVDLATKDLGESVANDKPGYMSANFSISLAMNIINTTPGRKLAFESVSGVTKPLGNPKFLVSAVWDVGNPICMAAAQPNKPCAIIMGYGYADASVPAEGMVTLKTYKGEPSGHLTAGLAGIAEDDWPALQEALKKPAALLISYDGGKYQRFGCKMHSKLGALIAASAEGYGCGTVSPEVVRMPASS